MSPGTHHEEEALGKVYDAQLLRRLLHYARPYWKAIAVAVVLSLFYAVLETAIPLFFKVGIDRYMSPTEDAAHELTFLNRYLPDDPWTGLQMLSAIFLVVLLLSFAFEYARTRLTLLTGQYVMYDLRRALFGHLQRLPISFFDRNPVGRLVTRVTSDVDQLNEAFSAGVVAIFGDLFMLVGFVVVMLMLNWKLALLSFSVIPLILLATQLFRFLVRDAFRRTRIAIARINAFLNEHLSGMAVVQLFNREQAAARRFDEINNRNREAWKAAILAHAWFYPAVEIISLLAIALILWRGGLYVIQGVAETGTIVAFFLYTQRFFRPIQDLSEKYNLLQAAMAASERIFKLLDAPVTVVSPAQPLPVPPNAGRVEFRNVWFAYQDQEWVLKDVSFTLEPGEMAAIVGHTGAGKTTLTNLLLRFYDVEKGQILLDGVDIRELDIQELRRQFGIVLQDPFLFSGTIASNVRLGSEGVSDEHVSEALENVNLGGFLSVLPEGLHHEVRERGATLSVGQKQLLSFARALAHRPRLLILDEATSSVDTHTEFQIRAALERLITDRTSIVIAHRLSTVQRAHQILVLHKGELRERGTHQQLLAQRGLYYKLYQLQYRDQEVGAVADDD
ncbi:MAG: ABC transporter ATP-binding protein [Candidatus Acidoferrales bacterium]